MQLAKNISSLTAGGRVFGAPTGEAARLFARVVMLRKGRHAYIAPDETSAREFVSFVRFFEPELTVLRLPAWDCPPYDRISPSALVASQRCAVLTRLAGMRGDETALVVTTAAGIAQRVPPPDHFRGAGLVLSLQGRSATPEQVQRYLSANGYVRTSIVRDHGEYAMRGGIVDLFPAGEPEPLRLDYFGDELETIRTFDPQTQRSTSTRKELLLAPVTELDFSDEGLGRLRNNYLHRFGPPAGDADYEAARERIKRQGAEHWLPLYYDDLAKSTDYLSGSPLIGLTSETEQAASERQTQIKSAYEARTVSAVGGRSAKVLPPESLYLVDEGWTDLLDGAQVLRFSPSDGPERPDHVLAGGRAPRNFAAERLDPKVDLFASVAGHFRSAIKSRQVAVLAVSSAGARERFRNFLMEQGFNEIEEPDTLEQCSSDRVNLAILPARAGFETDQLVLLTESDILGERRTRSRAKRSSFSQVAEATALSVGDLVVHIEHGVARYAGLRTVDVAGAEHDCFELVYAGDDKVLLPVENAELLSRYGAETGEGALDRLGSASWQSRKARARKKIMDMAEELIALAAARELKEAPRLTNEDGSFEDFSARFPYDETEDQLSAIGDVIEDLASGKPMDRLICGDVGFGKTEVALRAAFLAASCGMQVALIAPTTLLARQHAQTFIERFNGWPLKIRQLSRFVSTAAATKTRGELADGTCDIVVGTHALLSDKVEFKRLGLLIVDEEQRFGVKHKERLKEIRADVHVLTMTATPIPRTLQMSLSGIRDLSLIATPPADRLAVRTYLMEFDEVAIQEALLREHYRGGQSYFVTPRISDIPFIERFLNAAVPDLKVVVAHGQMSSSELEKAMTDFYEGRGDVLLSTTIVESGLDVPRANTLVVYRSDLFGLAQLYQLRGRVGRSKLRAYAYITTPEEEVMTETARKRLKVLHSLDSLGAGFMLASHDLDMRGGGNLLGEAQSGHIREVGVELYQSMLEEAVRGLKSGDVDFTEEWSPQIEVGVAVRIPESYVEDLSERLALYRRIAALDGAEDRQELRSELMDRFGPVPEETQHLLEITGLKASCKSLGVARLTAGPKGVLLAFRPDTPVRADKIVEFVRQKPDELKFRPDAKLVFTGHWPSPDARIRAVAKFLKEFQAAVN